MMLKANVVYRKLLEDLKVLLDIGFLEELDNPGDQAHKFYLTTARGRKALEMYDRLKELITTSESKVEVPV